MEKDERLEIRLKGTEKEQIKQIANKHHRTVTEHVILSATSDSSAPYSQTVRNYITANIVMNILNSHKQIPASVKEEIEKELNQYV